MQVAFALALGLREHVPIQPFIVLLVLERGTLPLFVGFSFCSGGVFTLFLQYMRCISSVAMYTITEVDILVWLVNMFKLVRYVVTEQQTWLAFIIRLPDQAMLSRQCQ